MNDTIEIHEEKQDKGFTLVELLIVIVILGILATVTVFAVGGITDSAETNACATELATIETAAEAYFVDNNSYPADADQLGIYLREVPTTGDYTIDTTTGAVTAAAGDCAAS
ncbi:MAG: prepilin-type N-terminal cleavage/methylation domain-containing protein [Ilumatobacteraceae bacterium]